MTTAPNRRIIPGKGARASLARATHDMNIGDEVAIRYRQGGVIRGTITKFYGRAGVAITRTEEGVQGQREYITADEMAYIEPLAEFRARLA